MEITYFLIQIGKLYISACHPNINWISLQTFKEAQRYSDDEVKEIEKFLTNNLIEYTVFRTVTTTEVCD